MKLISDCAITTRGSKEEHLNSYTIDQLSLEDRSLDKKIVVIEDEGLSLGDGVKTGNHVIMTQGIIPTRQRLVCRL